MASRYSSGFPSSVSSFVRQRRGRKAFVSFDFLFSVLSILLIVSHTMLFASFLESRATEKMERQILFDKLVSVSNYAVKAGAAKTEGEGFPDRKVYPNLIASENFHELEKNMKERLHLASLHIGFEKTRGTCIYRLVVYEPTDEIRKLYFCGE